MREGFNKQLYRDDTWQWTENWKDVGEVTATRSCQWSGPGCHQGCNVIFYTKDNKLLKIEGDPNSPVNDGRLCMRCLNMVEMVNHPDRIHTPLRRIGERGSNQWEEISWDEAYDEIVAKAKEITEKYGAKAISTGMGTGRNASWQTPSLAFAGFKTPNDNAGLLSGDSCYTPRMMAMNALFGSTGIADMGQALEKRFDDPRYHVPDMMLIWGNNPIVTNADGFFGHWVIDCMKRGMKIIVVDPRLTWLASKAEAWIQLRPGTDGAVALAFLHVMIEEGLYDAEFVEKWTYGFDALKERVADKTPEWAAEIAWCKPEAIYKAARAFGQAGRDGTTTLQWGLKLDQQTHGVAAAHGVACIQIITGHIDDPGGFMCINFGYTQSDIRESIAKDMASQIREGRLGDEYGALRRMGYAPHSSTDATLVAMETGEPYPIRMVYLCSTNPITNMGAESYRIYQAMKNLEFCVVCDLFITPTAAAFADIFLPVAMGCERSGIRGWYTPLRAINKVIDAGGKGDEVLMLELGKRLNPEYFPWDTMEEFDNYCMENLSSVPLKMTFKELQEKVVAYPDFEYKKYEKGLLRRDGKPGFQTATGRIELYCTMYDMAGIDPLPYFHEPIESPVSTPENFEKYPFVLSTGARSWEFFHSEHRQSKAMREFHPWPLVTINTEDAERLGIKDGDWVTIENPHGKCREMAFVTPTILKGVVHAEHGWWYPEEDGAEPNLFGNWKSNANCLTTMCEFGPSGYGAPYNNQICNIYKED